MKKTPATKSRKVADMAKEYRFDYTKAKPNHFAEEMKPRGWVLESILSLRYQAS
jgi:hypothetical protein